MIWKCLLIFCFFGLLSDGCKDQNKKEESGAEGTVFRGPIHGGPVRYGENDEEGFQALFHVYTANQNNFITSFLSEKDGRFHVMLSPGDYRLVPDASAPIINASRQVKEVKVYVGHFTGLTLHFDTGLL
jgi:hypothetical protein